MFREEMSLMQRVNEYRFYELGQKIGAIQQVRQDTTYDGAWIALWDARMALQSLMQDVVSVRITLPVVGRLINAINTIVPSDLSEAVRKTNDEKPAVIGYAFYDLQEALKAFEPVLAAECTALDTYVVSQKRGYSTPDLVDRCEVMLPQETIGLLEDSVIADIRAAGRCLAFDVPTAAGFHILRAVEAVMAMYYTHLTGRQLTKRNRNWGAYLKALEVAPNVDVKVHGALSHIKDNYRNPITHPEDRLTEGQAIMLFGLSLSVMELMAEPLRSVPPALTDLEEAKALTELAEQNASAAPEDF